MQGPAKAGRYFCWRHVRLKPDTTSVGARPAEAGHYVIAAWQ
jgi:hypothetical protein